MKIALIQTRLIWENPTKNKAIIEEKINSISQYVDLIVLPEMFSSGFTMNPVAVAEGMDGPTLNWLKTIAQTRQCALTGSLVIEENGHYYNRLVFVYPDGNIQTYDKRHLFSLAGEHRQYTAGTQKLIVEYQGFRICPLVCYDLRFPVFSRNTENYDLLLYVANWPKPRTQAWDILLRARAVENLSYTIGVNRVGTDGNGHDYLGHSQVVGPLGDYLLEPQEEEGIFIVALDQNTLQETRNKFAFLNDRDDFELQI